MVNKMRTLYIKIIDALAAWLFRPKQKHTRSCREIAEDEKKKKSGSA